jgi:hypothetical protein
LIARSGRTLKGSLFAARVHADFRAEDATKAVVKSEQIKSCRTEESRLSTLQTAMVRRSGSVPNFWLGSPANVLNYVECDEKETHSPVRAPSFLLASGIWIPPPIVLATHCRTGVSRLACCGFALLSNYNSSCS